MKRTFRTLLPLGSLLVAAACNNSVEEPAAIQNRLTLTGFGSCSELEQYIEDEAVRDMKTQLDCMKSDGWCGFGFRGGLEAAADASASPPAAAGPAAYTKTNVQVAGVDEADFMKNDGTRIFVISGQKLHAVKSWPANQLAEQSALELEGYPTQMYLDEKNRVVVFSSVYTKYDGFNDGSSGGGGIAADSALCAPGSCGFYGNTTKVTVVDVSNIAALKVTSEYYLPGSYANSRRIDSSVRMVLSDYFRWPVAVKWWPTSNDPNLWQNPTKLAAELDRLKVENEAILRAQTLDKWLPLPKRKLADGRIVDVQYDCRDFSRSNAPVHMGLATVATLNLDNLDAGPSRTSIVGQTGEIYASKNSLYIATPHWWWWPAPGQTDYTYFHKFDLSDKNKAQYVASGGVEGHIVDQFSMDEDKGYFRVATTISTRVPDKMNPMNRWGTLELTNRISVLREDAGRILVTGASEDIAKGERITSSRFLGDKAFIVTFRNIDPLFTFDMSNPTAPRRVGELKVPGFSSYIHPLDDTHLLTVGTYIPDPGTGGMVNWQERRLQLSIFDTSNFANPVQSFNQLVGTAYGWSEANWDHHAFNYFPERKLLAIPFSDYVASPGDPWGRFVSELKVYGVSTASGFTDKGSLTMKDVYVSAGTPEWYYWYSPWVRRSVMATDNVNDFVYAVSDAGIRVATATALGTPLATVVFKRDPWK